MSYFLTILGLVGTGLAWLHLTRLATRRLAVDLPLAWFVGEGWFACAIAGLRILGGVPYGRPAAVAVLAVPMVGLVLRRKLGARVEARAPELAAPPRTLPRPLWLFAPLAAYVLVAAYAVAVHGFDSPTQTDDGLRLRAFTPVVALADEWGPEARELLPLAGTLPTFVPTLAWRLTGELDPFHLNYMGLTGFLGLLVLVVGLGTSRGRPAAGWAMAFALTSLPLYLYHCTSTHTDALLALHVGAGFAFALEYERTRAPADAARALLLFVVAAFVKREGALMAACAAGPLALQLAWNQRRTLGALRGFAWLLAPLALDLGSALRAVGVAKAFPVLALLGFQGSASAPSAPAVAGSLVAPATRAFVEALFRSGNAGMLYWILAATLLVRAPALARGRGLVPLFSVAALFAVTAASSIWLIPQYTLDETTVHRALLTVSVAASLWLATTLADALADERERLARAPSSPLSSPPLSSHR